MTAIDTDVTLDPAPALSATQWQPSEKRCDVCGAQHDDMVAEAACFLHTALKADLLAHAHTLTPEPTIAQVLDPWAHTRRLTAAGRQAARWTRKVLDLGWRPHIPVPTVPGPSTPAPALADDPATPTQEGADQ